MSEKYSTDELMGEVQSHLDYGQHMIPTPVCSSIIARLRAADALCEAAKGLVSSCTPELYDEYFEATKKAIAGYEDSHE